MDVCETTVDAMACGTVLVCLAGLAWGVIDWFMASSRN